MYKVLINFADLQDNNYRYHAGETFPRKGVNVTPERIDELLTDKNRRHKPVIEEVKEPTKKEPTPEPKVVAEEKTVETPKRGRKKKEDVK